MTSIASACRLGARYAAQNANAVRRRVAARDFSSAPQLLAAHNFVMPAMSPTMTEGNIAAWKVKEGDTFSVGDILLEIETDKAQMDVEAQDDGIMAKIITQDGSKSVKVGTRIAVLADPDDDINTLEIPPDNGPAATPKKESTQSSQPQQQDAKQSAPEPTLSQQPTSQPSKASSSTSSAHPPNQNYPLYPSVQHLLHTRGLSSQEASKIPATGPSGRLLKGDVLAYIGTINKSYVDEQAERIESLAHLDLTNIKKAPPREAPKKADATTAPPPLEPETEIAVPISLASVFRVRNKIHDSLGVDLPLSTFFARASEIANENLPRSTSAAPTADELFDDVLGLDSSQRRRLSGTRGHFLPQITPLPPPAAAVPRPRQPPKKIDAIDILAGRKPAPAPVFDDIPDDIGMVPGGAGANNVFSLVVKKGEEKRARVYLERVKSVLEVDPGRCVL